MATFLSPTDSTKDVLSMVEDSGAVADVQEGFIDWDSIMNILDAGAAGATVGTDSTKDSSRIASFSDSESDASLPSVDSDEEIEEHTTMDTILDGTVAQKRQLDRGVSFELEDVEPKYRTGEKRKKRDHEDDTTKIRRIGSLNRIIASSHAVQPTLTGVAFVESKQLKAGVIFSSIVNAFNTCDLDALSKLVRNHLHPQCELQSSSLDDAIVGRKYIMMYWALQMETYPDGIYICSKSTVRGMSIERDYKFTGTRVFRRSTKQLYRHVRKQANLLDPSKSSYELDELSNILESCWLTSPHEVGATAHLPSQSIATIFAIHEAAGDTTTALMESKKRYESESRSTAVRSSSSSARYRPGTSAMGAAAAAVEIPVDSAAMILDVAPDSTVHNSLASELKPLGPRPASEAASSFTTANVLALALREQGSVVNAQKMISFTFNAENQIIRVSVSGDV